MKKISYLFVLSLLFIFLASPWAASESAKKGNPPVITNSYAVERGSYGFVWRIYIEAEDPDGDMSRIAAVVEQPGYGLYPPDWVVLKSSYRNHLKGYLQWNTFSNRAPYLREWTHILLRISVFDRAGNESNEVSFPFEFVSGKHREGKLPPPFDTGELPRLGYLNINLFEPSLMGAGNHRDD